MRSYRLIAAGAVIALALATSSVASARLDGHRGTGFGSPGWHGHHGGPPPEGNGFERPGWHGHHGGPPPEEEVSPPGAPPGVIGAWADQVNRTGFETTPLGTVNGYVEERRNTGTPSLSSFSAYSGVESLAGTEPITVYTACTPAGSECTAQSPGVKEEVGDDGCNPCTLYGPSGEVLGTGSIEMPWWQSAASNPEQPGTHQHVALLQHGTGALADVHGVLTHPGTTDPRCAQGALREGFVGCYVGTVHTDRCISGAWYGPLWVPPGQTACLSPGARVFGPTHLGYDSELFAEGASFFGPIHSDRAEAFSLCESSVLGSVSVTGTTGPVLIGEPVENVCGGNLIQGALNVERNGCATCDADGRDTGSVDISGDTILGSLRSTENVGAYVLGDFVSNTVLGAVTSEGNS